MLSFAPGDGQKKPFGNFVVLWVTQSVSILGDFLTLFGLTIWLTVVRYPDASDRDSLAFALSAITVGQAVVGLALSTVLGAIVDRYDRRELMIASEMVNGSLSLSLAILALTGNLEVWLMLPIVWLGAGVSQLHALAFESSIVHVVDQEHLARSSGMMSAMNNAVQVLAAPIGLALISLARTDNSGAIGSVIRAIGADTGSGTAIVFAVDALTFVVAFAGLLVVTIPTPGRIVTSNDDRVFGDALAGASFVWRNKPLLLLLSLGSVGNIAATAGMVLLPIVIANLETNYGPAGWSFERSLTVVTTMAGVAGITGGIVMSVWGGFKRNRAYVVGAAVVIGSILMIVMGMATTLWLAAIAWALSTFILPIQGAHSKAIWQSRTPLEMQGRVFAIRLLIAGGLVPVSALMAGRLAGQFDAGHVVAGFGVVGTVIALVQLLHPMLKDADRPFRQSTHSWAGD